MCRSTPAEAFEGERLGKRVRKKKKMFMESGDEEEDNIEEEEVIHIHISHKRVHIRYQQDVLLYCSCSFYFLVFQEKVKSSKGRRAAKVARLGW